MLNQTICDTKCRISQANCFNFNNDVICTWEEIPVKLPKLLQSLRKFMIVELSLVNPSRSPPPFLSWNLFHLIKTCYIEGGPFHYWTGIPWTFLPSLRLVDKPEWEKTKEWRECSRMSPCLHGPDHNHFFPRINPFWWQEKKKEEEERQSRQSIC